nr:MBL fold metallo-hydrolase [Desulfobacula sp.]
MIGCPQAGVACVVDPKRDVQDYIEVARENNLRITHIFETHVHADHISGNMEIKSRTGADTCTAESRAGRKPVFPLSNCGIFLQNHGFVHVHSLAGGTTAWRNSGYELIV